MEFDTWEQFVATCERDLRRGTLFYPSLGPPAPGTTAMLMLVLPHGQEIGLRTRVARVVSQDLALALGCVPGAWLRLAPSSARERDAVSLLARKARISIPDFPPDLFAEGTRPELLGVPAAIGAEGSSPGEVNLPSLRAHLETLMRADAHTVLDLPTNASLGQVRTAYEGLCRRWHPARFIAADEETRETVAEIAIRIESAYRTLENASRHDWQSRLEARAGGKHLAARRCLECARIALDHGDVALATEEFETALQLVPGCKEAVRGLERIGKLKRETHRGSLQRILTRGRQ